MTQLTILSAKQRKAFDHTPVFTQQERQPWFQIDADTRRHIAQLKTPVNRLGYRLQMGYFKAPPSSILPVNSEGGTSVM